MYRIVIDPEDEDFWIVQKRVSLIWLNAHYFRSEKEAERYIDLLIDTEKRIQERKKIKPRIYPPPD